MVDKILGDEILMDSHGREVTVASTLSYDLIGLYFSAHWCPPCRIMTPKLGGYYSKTWSVRKKICIIFISFDRDEETMMDYFEEMPWLAVPYSQRERCDQIANTFGIDAIPGVVVLKKTGEVKYRQTVTLDGGRDVSEKAEGALDYWLDLAFPKNPPPVAASSESSEKPALAIEPPLPQNEPPKVEEKPALAPDTPHPKKNPEIPAGDAVPHLQIEAQQPAQPSSDHEPVEDVRV